VSCVGQSVMTKLEGRPPKRGKGRIRTTITIRRRKKNNTDEEKIEIEATNWSRVAVRCRIRGTFFC